MLPQLSLLLLLLLSSPLLFVVLLLLLVVGAVVLPPGSRGLCLVLSLTTLLLWVTSAACLNFSGDHGLQTGPLPLARPPPVRLPRSPRQDPSQPTRQTVPLHRSEPFRGSPLPPG